VRTPLSPIRTPSRPSSSPKSGSARLRSRARFFSIICEKLEMRRMAVARYVSTVKGSAAYGLRFTHVVDDGSSEKGEGSGMSVWYVANTDTVGRRRLPRKEERCGADVVASWFKASIIIRVPIGQRG
jgi:hypothetical protein